MAGMVRGAMRTGFGGGNKKTSDHFEDLGVGLKITIERMLNMSAGSAWIGMIRLRMGAVGELLLDVVMKHMEFLLWPRDRRFVRTLLHAVLFGESYKNISCFLLSFVTFLFSFAHNFH
jgi:hypothetical protein